MKPLSEEACTPVVRNCRIVKIDRIHRWHVKSERVETYAILPNKNMGPSKKHLGSSSLPLTRLRAVLDTFHTDLVVSQSEFEFQLCPFLAGRFAVGLHLPFWGPSEIGPRPPSRLPGPLPIRQCTDACPAHSRQSM